MYVWFIPDEVMVLAVWWITDSNTIFGFYFGGTLAAMHTQVETCPVPGELHQPFRASKRSLKLLTTHVTGIEGM